MAQYTRPKPNGPRQDQQCGDWPFRLGRFPGETAGSMLMFCAVLDKAWQEHDVNFLYQGYYDHYGDLFDLDLPRVIMLCKQPANSTSLSNH